MMGVAKDITNLIQPFSSYPMRQLERLYVVGAGILFVALIVMVLSPTFYTRLPVFIVFVVVIYFIPEISRKLFGKLKPSPQEEEVIYKIKSSDKSEQEKEDELKKMFPKQAYTQVLGVILLTWWFLIGLYLLLGLGKFLLQFEAIQALIELVPTEMFKQKGVQRTDAVIEMMKLYKLFHFVTIPWVGLGIYWSLYPLIKEPRYFPMIASHLYGNTDLTRKEKVKKGIFYIVGFVICIIAGTVGWVIIINVDGYMISIKDNPFIKADVRFWFQANLICLLPAFHLLLALRVIDDAVNLTGQILSERKIK
jgi:hypothetical protein